MNVIATKANSQWVTAPSSSTHLAETQTLKKVQSNATTTAIVNFARTGM
jgi:hypothetical protein